MKSRILTYVTTPQTINASTITTMPVLKSMRTPRSHLNMART